MTMTLKEAIQSIKKDDEISKTDFVEAIERAISHAESEDADMELAFIQLLMTQVAVNMLVRTKRIRRDDTGGLFAMEG